MFWTILGNIHREPLFLVKKVTLSEKRTEILRQFVLLPMFQKGQILRKICICLNNYFLLNQKKEKTLTKTVFLPKVSHILLNYAFRLFWSIFGEIHREIFFLIKNVTISEMSTEILRKFFFLTMLEKGQILMKIWICLNNFFWPNQ